MQSKRIHVPASRRADINTRSISAGCAVSGAMLSQARQAMGAGPAWGRPATTVLVLVYGSAIVLASRAGWLASPAVSITVHYARAARSDREGSDLASVSYLRY